ncbi:MAG TPA: MFS transporter [Candidatus Limnocylindria bacterium]|nr:MFS transporter [Candidatus Limnocylindria bacterium]
MVRASSPRLTLALLSTSHAVIHAQSALMPLIYPIIIAQYALAPSDIGLFIAVTTAVGGSMQLLYGFLTRHVARPVLLGAGQLLFGAGLVSGGVAASPGQLLASISAARVGASPQHPVGNALLSDVWPAQRRGFAISAHISGGNVGTVLVPFVGLALIGAVGWNATLALFGIPALIAGSLILILVREDTRAYRAAAREAGSVRGQVRALLGRSDLRLILSASLVAAGGRGLDIVAPFMLLYMRGPLGIDESTTALLYALLLVGAVIGPLLAGVLSDRFGRRRTLVVYYLLSAAGVLAFLAAGSNLWLLVPLLLPFGTAVFSESPVLQAFLADRAVGPMRDVAFSVYFTFAFGIGSFWALVVGNVVTWFDYPAAFVLMAASYLGAALLLGRVRDGVARGAPAGTT